MDRPQSSFTLMAPDGAQAALDAFTKAPRESRSSETRERRRRNRRMRHAIRWALSLLLGLPALLSVMWRLPEEQRLHMTSVDRTIVQVTNYIGDASFALTGALAAGTEGMDALGCVIVGIITALGGGTVRDIALGLLPVFWAKAWDELILCVAVAGTGFFLWTPLSDRFGLSTEDEWVFWTDTLGLGVFAALGAKTAAVLPGVHFGTCLMSGMFTATFGGLTRDVLCRRPPRILYSTQEIYAIPALCGAAVCTTILRCRGTSWEMEAVLVGAWVTIEMRVFAVNLGLRLPSFPRDKIFKTAQDRLPPSDFLPSYQLTAVQANLQEKLKSPLLWSEEVVAGKEITSPVDSDGEGSQHVAPQRKRMGADLATEQKKQRWDEIP